MKSVLALDRACRVQRMSERQNLFIALYDRDGVRSAALKSRLSSMGHRAIVFTRMDNFLEVLEEHQRFDLLLAPLQDGLPRKVLSAGGDALGMPALLLVEGTQWGQLLLRNEDAEARDAIEFDVLRTTNEELDWRMRTLLARTRKNSAQSAQASELAWGDYRFIERHRIVLHREREIFLQPRQFDFALELFRNMDCVVTRDWLWNVLWRSTSQRSSRGFDVCATNVRRKLALHEENGFVLKAVYGQGYLLSRCPAMHDEVCEPGSC
ncbi:winged helix-turn-helix domain-containing protein [Variovorax sp. ZS18.2.2]|uniref:helix-turn-helix domain-containing protein n=1 Tax=Variovorax sp. ZS18.2.2 TaxID=2971255 RepID=UPI0021512AD0|nr:winged helix-turn-helix domain-containing protein [Variovorax sp. ZS18.2.2]MCR6478154.1 winged helix-turn-helix domain-containing protein [Variovorax sp. ZS18.2.2]